MRKEGKITYLNYKSIVVRERNNLQVWINITGLINMITKSSSSSWQSFESQSFNPFSVNEDLKNNDQDPDVNFYQTQISSVDTSYYIPNEVKEKLENFQQKSFSLLHLNICSMRKKFELFREFLDSLCFTFSAICLSETWCHETSNSNLQIPGYISLH